MKKITLYLIGILLMINIMCGNIIVLATEQQEEQNNEEITEEQNTDGQNEEELVHSQMIVTAEVIGVKEVQENEEGKFQEVTIEILEGDYETEEFTVNYSISSNGNIEKYQLKEGDKVIVELSDDESGNVSIFIKSIKRTWIIFVLFGLVVFSYSLLADKKLIKQILSFIITIIVLYFILLKGMVNDGNIVKNSIVVGILLILINTILSIGLNKKALSAIIASFIGMSISGIMGVIFVHLAKISSFLDDFTFFIQKDLSGTNFANLIFSSVLISSLGICINTAISIVLSLDEIKNKTKDISWKELYKDGIEIGKNLIKNQMNMLILMCLGTNLIVIFAEFSSGLEILEVINSDYFITELILAISSTLGMVLTVPIIAILYGLLNSKKTIYRTKSDNKLDGQRSLKL